MIRNRYLHRNHIYQWEWNVGVDENIWDYDQLHHRQNQF